MKHLKLYPILYLPFVGFIGCATTTPSTGSNTNWVTCHADGDCETGHPCVEQRCEGQAAPNLSLSVSVWFSADAVSKGAQLAWLGGAPVSARAQSSQTLTISRAFDSVAEARAFSGTFVASEGGREIARDVAAFTDCDVVTTYGLDPGTVRLVRIARSSDGSTLSKDNLSNSVGPVGCFWSSPDNRPPTGSKESAYRLPTSSGEKLSFAFDGQEVLPRSLALFADRQVWEVALDVRDDQDASLGDLSVRAGSDSFGAVPVSLDGCIEPNNVVIEREVWLTLNTPDGGVTPHVAPDPYGDTWCLYSDGTESDAIP